MWVCVKAGRIGTSHFTKRLLIIVFLYSAKICSGSLVVAKPQEMHLCQFERVDWSLDAVRGLLVVFGEGLVRYIAWLACCLYSSPATVVGGCGCWTNECEENSKF